MSILSKFIGNAGEALAHTHLKKNGYSILKQQHLTKFIEVDILAEKGGTIYIFEVKTITQKTKTLADIIDSPFSPIRRVNRKKIRRMTSFAEHYINERPRYTGASLGIIIVTFTFTLKKPEIAVVLV